MIDFPGKVLLGKGLVVPQRLVIEQKLFEDGEVVGEMVRYRLHFSVGANLFAQNVLMYE